MNFLQHSRCADYTLNSILGLPPRHALLLAAVTAALLALMPPVASAETKPLKASVETIEMCEFDPELDDPASGADVSGEIIHPAADNTLEEDKKAGILRARAQGVAGARRTAITEAGFRFTPNASFKANFDLDMSFSGRLHDHGGAPALLRINYRLVEEGADGEGCDVLPCDQLVSEEKSGPVDSPTASFTNADASDSFSADLKGGSTYRLVIHLRASSRGSDSDANFDTGGRGLTVDCLKISPKLVDSDGDAIFDSWETTGIDADGNDENDIDLTPAELGVDFRGVPIVLDPMRKDILVEIDYFDCAEGGDCTTGDNHNHSPMISAMQRVVDAFAAAPVNNPEGPSGINLWIVISDAIAHQQVCAIDDGCIAGIKQNNMGPGQGLNTAEGLARALIFHYSLFAHALDTPTGRTSGRADGGDCNAFPEPRWGDDFIVALGNWSTPDGTEVQQAGTFMHELGHNLGLCHGGFEETNCKPNYQSVMNYSFQTRGIPTMSGAPIIDYSRETLGSLSESANDGGLDESVGINNGVRQTYYGPLSDTDADGMADDLNIGNGSGFINWNLNNDALGNPFVDPPGIAADVNNLAPVITRCVASPGETLLGHNDWDKLIYDLRSSELSGDGLGAPEGQDIELTGDEADALDAATFWLRRNPKYDYAAKLICGTQADEGVLRLVRGTYGTTINILNPNGSDAEFEKSLVLAFPPAEQKAGNVHKIALDTLQGGRALKVDCNDIRQKLFKDGFPATEGEGGYIEGFVTLESDKRLDVIGVYTLASVDDDGRIVGGASIDLERVVGSKRAHPDLSISKSAQVTGSPTTSEVTYTITVKNVGDAPAQGAMVTDSLEVSEASITNLAPGNDFVVVSESLNAAQLQAPLGIIQPGSSVELVYRVKTQIIGANSQMSLTNTASVDLDADPVAVNDTVTLVTTPGN